MARHAVRIAFDGAKLLIAAIAVEARRLKAHRIHIRTRRSEFPRLVLDRLDQSRAEILAAIFLLDPEQLDEQHRGPDLANDPADDLAALAEGDREALVFLLPHLLGVVTDEAAEHRLLGLANGALDGELRHGLAERHVDGGFR